VFTKCVDPHPPCSSAPHVARITVRAARGPPHCASERQDYTGPDALSSARIDGAVRINTSAIVVSAAHHDLMAQRLVPTGERPSTLVARRVGSKTTDVRDEIPLPTCAWSLARRATPPAQFRRAGRQPRADAPEEKPVEVVLRSERPDTVASKRRAQCECSSSSAHLSLENTTDF
jgi:hypothetical protein